MRWRLGSHNILQLRNISDRPGEGEDVCDGDDDKGDSNNDNDEGDCDCDDDDSVDNDNAHCCIGNYHWGHKH